jgi:superfamily II DNA or RNA helicase
MSILEKLSPEVVFGWIPDPLADRAREDIAAGRVTKPRIRRDAIEAVVGSAGGRPVRTRLLWAGGPAVRCQCGAAGSEPCRHAAALALMLAGEARTVDEEDARENRLTGSPAGEERRRRQERGASGVFRVRPRQVTGVFGTYGVASPSGRAYEVIVRSLERPENSCSCSDFETNLLGTCKHIEAVLAGRARRRRGARATPGWSYLFMAFDPERRVAGRLRAGAGSREKAAVARIEAGAAPWPDLFAEAESAGIEVPREVTAFARRVLATAENARRASAIEDDVRRAGVEQAGFRLRLYPYQVDGVAFLCSRGRALLADDMGLGKTAQAIAALSRLQRSDGVRRTLVVCPASLKHQWQREILRCLALGPEDVTIVGGPRAVRRAAYDAGPQVLITSYELARADEAQLDGYGPDLLVLDEAQRIKNWRTLTAAAAKRIRSRFAFVLTGTPLENRLDDLYSLMQVIDPHLLGPLWRFNQDFTRLDARGRVSGYHNLGELRRRLAPVMLRRRKEDVLRELPPRIVNRVVVPMTEEQRAVHDEAEGQVARLLARLKKRPLTPQEEKHLLRAFQRMRMACDAEALVGGPSREAPKLGELRVLLDEICVQGGRKVVVFSEWERMQSLAAGVCEGLGLGHVRLHGGVPAGARGKLIDRFREDPTCKVFLSTDAGGVGINLQAASHLVNLDLPWNPAVLAQRIGRIHRLGQSEPANVVLLVSEASFEERMEVGLGAKRALFAAAVGDSDAEEIERSSLATRIATIFGEAAAATGAPPTATGASDPVADLRERIGARLERIVRLPDGRLAAITRSGAGDSALALPDGVVALSAPVAAAMASLGALSPLHEAEVIFEAPPAAEEDPLARARQALVKTGERKLAAARMLLDGDLRSEALGLVRDAIAIGCRTLSDEADPGEAPARLAAALYGQLVPAGKVSQADADTLARASELARAFADDEQGPPAALVVSLLGHATDMLSRARERIVPAGPNGRPRPSPAPPIPASMAE